MKPVTDLLQQVEAGDSAAAEALLPLVYDELRKHAAELLALENPGQSIQATSLVHEAWVRLVDVDYTPCWASQRHFFGAAAEAMRRILVERARRRQRQRHGVDLQRITVQLDGITFNHDDELLESLDEALQTFAQVDPVACQLVNLRYFAGLSLKDAALALDIPPRTADRLWAYAKVWLMRQIER